MNLLLLIALAIVVLLMLAVVAAAVLKATRGEPDAGPNLYAARSSLFSPAERSFLGVLELIDLGELTVTSKVRLADIFEVKPGLDRSARQTAINRITSKHVDFLLIQKTDGKPILGIELDDKSHERASRVKRDAFVDETFQATGLPLLRLKAQATYNPQTLLSQIESALKPPSVMQA